MADDSINFQFTAKGQQLASQALAGTVKLDFTKAVASTDNHFSDSVATIAALTTLANVKQTATISEVDRVAEDDTEVRIPVTFDKSQVGDDYQLLTVGLYCKPDNGAEVLYAIAGLANPILMHKSTTDSTYSIDMYVVVGTSDNVTIKVNPAGAVTHADLATTLGDYAKTVDVNQQLATKADDSKVAHLSGANNFDTAPTVNNNPLFIANYYTVDLTDAKYDRNKWYYVDSGTSSPGFLDGGTSLLGSMGGLSYFTLEAPLFSGIDVPYGVHNSGNSKDACARQTVLYSQGKWGSYNRKLTVIEDQTDLTTDGKRLLTFAVPSDNNLNYAFYARGGLKVNIISDVPGLTWTPHTDTFVENETTISVLNYAPDPKALGLDDDHTFWALPMSQFNQQLKSYVTAVTQLNSTDMNTVLTAGLYLLRSGTNGIPNADAWTLYQVIPLSGSNGVQLVYGTNKAVLGMRSWSTINGAITFTSWVQFADDSKVAHLSGANNFDTVPTVNNNPLLLASSLPSDLARTGQDTNFTAGLQKSGIDVATTDDLTIVYAGVPSLSFDNNGNYTITASKNADIAHITDYTLYYRVKGTGDFTQVALTPDKLTGTIDLSKVTTATNFESYATATNVFGESDPSSMVQWSYDPEKASSTPPSLTIADDGTYTITAPATTPTPIVKYFLYYNVDGQSDANKLDVGTKLTGSLKELITKPDKTTTYDVQATAMNANAESGVSNSVQFTYVPIDDSIYGASWDRKSSPTLTRTDAAVGLKAGINGSQNDFDNVGPWKGMHRVTDSMNNVFVRVPKFYIRKTQTGASDNGTATWQVSLVSHGDDWYLPKGFWDFANSKELDYIDIGAYHATGSSSKLTSTAGKAPLTNLSIINFRSAAKANGTGYQIWDIHAWDMLQVLFIIEFATLNSQSIMEGVDNGSSAANSGAADSHKGSSGTAGSGSNAMSYRGIENLYGNVWQLCDGVNFKDNQPWVCENATKYQSDLFAAPYVRTSYTATPNISNNYIKTLEFDSAHPYAQFTTDDSGSASTYYADYNFPGSGNTILETGGAWEDGAADGLFYSGRDNSSTGARAYAGCRLLKKALP